MYGSEGSHSGTLMYGSEGSHSGTLMYGSEGSHSGTLMYYYYFTYQYRYKKIMKVRESNEEGTLELIQWPSGLRQPRAYGLLDRPTEPTHKSIA